MREGGEKRQHRKARQHTVSGHGLAGIIQGQLHDLKSGLLVELRTALHGSWGCQGRDADRTGDSDTVHRICLFTVHIQYSTAQYSTVQCLHLQHYT